MECWCDLRRTVIDETSLSRQVRIGSIESNLQRSRHAEREDLAELQQSAIYEEDEFLQLPLQSSSHAVRCVTLRERIRFDQQVSLFSLRRRLCWKLNF